MASRVKYRKKWLRWLDRYERLAARELQKTFHKYASNMPFDIMNEQNYEYLIQNAITDRLMFNTYLEIYTKIGLTHGSRVGKGINQQIKTNLKVYTESSFTTLFERNIFKYIVNSDLTRIRTVEQTYYETIRQLFVTGLAEGKDFRVVANEIKKLVNKPSFYKWQALRIGRTESTAAANYSATQAGKVSGYKMEKEWISALDKRTRDPHASANGQKVKENESFLVGGERLAFPGAPGGSAANVVNCRCAVAMTPAKDKNGDMIEVN
jgi:uncharacterized protein with gpF-like domain